MSGGVNKKEDILRELSALVNSGVGRDDATIRIGKAHGIKPNTVMRYAQDSDLWKSFISPVEPKPIPQSSDPEIAQAVHTELKKQSQTVIELADILSVPPKIINAAIESLRSKHILIGISEGGIVSLDKAIPINTIPKLFDLSKNPEVEIPFGAVADTHIGSKYERLDVLNALYDRFEAYGVKDVYHGGNWIDGEAKFNKHDIYVNGATPQVKNFIQKYPKRNGITTHIISGDDHEGWYVQGGGLNIGNLMKLSAMDAGRFDLIDLGYMERDVELKQDGGSAILRIMHGGGGSAYATSYTSQKYVESLQGGEKPKIVLVGHFHKFDYSYPREVHVIQVGCCQDQTPFMRKKRLQAMVGGCVIWVKQTREGIIRSFKVEWIPFYDKKFYTYQF